jgi:hypothetical protein
MGAITMPEKHPALPQTTRAMPTRAGRGEHRQRICQALRLDKLTCYQTPPLSYNGVVILDLA